MTSFILKVVRIETEAMAIAYKMMAIEINYFLSLPI